MTPTATPTPPPPALAAATTVAITGTPGWGAAAVGALDPTARGVA